MKRFEQRRRSSRTVQGTSEDIRPFTMLMESRTKTPPQRLQPKIAGHCGNRNRKG